MAAGEHHLVLHAVRRGHDHDDSLHPGHVGGNRVHQHRRRIRRLAARDVDAHAVERRDFLAEDGAIRLGIGEAVEFLLLPLVEHADALRSHIEGIALGGGNTLQCRLQFGLADVEGGHAGGAAVGNAVEAVGVFEHGGVAARLDVGQDAGDGALDRFIGACFKCQQGVQGLFETGLGGIELGNLNRHDGFRRLGQ